MTSNRGCSGRFDGVERSVDVTVESGGPTDTAAIAQAIAAHVRAGDVLVLGGDLGAGKTTFTKAVGAALGVTEPITSPTFTLAQRYQGSQLEVHHLDVYRLDQLDEVIDLALPELFESGGVVMIEWGDKITPMLPADYLLVEFEFGDADDDRTLVLKAHGPVWVARIEAVGAALANSGVGQSC